MAESKNGKIYWHSPDPRAIIPLNSVKPPRSIRQTEKHNGFSYTTDKVFSEVILHCSERTDTWISDEIIESYFNLHKNGFAHSVETWMDGELVGGLYGVSIGAAFFGESMFSDVSGASKAAFYNLVDRLLEKNFVLLDTQYLNDHTLLLGAIEIPKSAYLKILKTAINLPCSFSDYKPSLQ
jgi:leucyl/phenylalanyl-tRNA--protein transferase